MVKGKQYIQKNLMPDNLLRVGETRLRFVWEGYHQWLREHAAVEEPSGGEPEGG